MEVRTLGNSGLRLSIVGIGARNFGTVLHAGTANAILDAAIDSGINFIDTADRYGGRGGSETALGELLGVRRRNVILATKFGKQMDAAGLLKGASRRYVALAVENSLRRLRTDWIDLYQLHEPDPSVPIEETLGVLDDLVCQGKIRHIGHSNFSADQLVEAHRAAQRLRVVSFVSSQSEYNLLNRDIEGDLLPAANALGLGLLPYLPLAAGALTGRFGRGVRSQRRPTNDCRGSERYRSKRAEVIVKDSEVCAAHNRSLLELAFGWLLSRQGVCCVMAGVSSVAQLKQNVSATKWIMSAEEISEVDRITGR